MEHGSSTSSRQRPECCPDCRRDFVRAIELVDFLDEGLFLIALECSNCGSRRVEELEDSQLESLELAAVRAQEQMLSAIRMLVEDRQGGGSSSEKKNPA